MITIPPGGTFTIGLDGHMALGGGSASGGWQPIGSAPRDGTIIEVRCTYGVAPWFGLYHWIESPFGGRWAKVGDDCSGFADDDSFSWRPHTGATQAYVDPTGGAQNTRAYWLRASGFNPRDYPGSELTFEQESAGDRESATTPKKRGFWAWLFD